MKQKTDIFSPMELILNNNRNRPLQNNYYMKLQNIKFLLFLFWSKYSLLYFVKEQYGVVIFRHLIKHIKICFPNIHFKVK